MPAHITPWQPDGPPMLSERAGQEECTENLTTLGWCVVGGSALLVVVGLLVCLLILRRRAASRSDEAGATTNSLMAMLLLGRRSPRRRSSSHHDARDSEKGSRPPSVHAPPTVPEYAAPASDYFSYQPAGAASAYDQTPAYGSSRSVPTRAASTRVGGGTAASYAAAQSTWDTSQAGASYHGTPTLDAGTRTRRPPSYMST